MARNGAGVYSNPYPNFVNGTVISSDQADANNAAIGTALTQSIAVDGQTTITANLPMNSNKFTGLSVGTAATDSLTLGQAQAQAFAWGGTAGGGADAITIAPTPAITAYAVGQKFFWIASGSANTGAATIAISGLTAIAMQDGGAALAAGVHAAGKVFMGVLNTTSTVQIMQVQSSGDPLTISALTVNGTSQFSGAIIQGVDGTGYDATFFGDTSGAYLMWDQSADKLLTAGGALIDIVKDKLMIGGTAVTTTAAELNFNDTATAGTVVASKTVVASADKDIASFRNITLTGELDAGSLDVSGGADIAGQTTIQNGSAGAPSLAASADTNTGLYYPAGDTLGVSVAGALDFQFEANDFTALSGSVISTNTIAETTGGSGVTVDGLLIKDGGLSDLVLPAVSGIVEANANFIDMCLVGPSIDGQSWNGKFSNGSVWTSLMLATVETSGSDVQLNIWDLTAGTLASATPLATLTLSGAIGKSIAASMGYVMVGTQNQGFQIFDPHTGAWAKRVEGALKSLSHLTTPPLADGHVFNVAIQMPQTGSPYDPNTGGLIPLIAWTYGGSADECGILNNGAVYNKNEGTAGDNVVAIDSYGFVFTTNNSSDYGRKSTVPIYQILADDWGTSIFFDGSGGAGPSFTGAQGDANKISLGPHGKVVTATDAGLNYGYTHASDSGSAFGGYVNRTFTTGYLGQTCVLAALANSDTADRSGNSHTLTKNGTITEAAVASGAELKAYSGWSSSNNLDLNDAAFDVGTSGFSLFIWIKTTSTSEELVVDYAQPDLSNGRFYFELASGSTNVGRFFVSDGSDTITVNGTSHLGDGEWHLVSMTFDGSLKTGKLYVDGNFEGTATNTAIGSVTNTSAVLHIGVAANGSSVPWGGSLSLLRFMASSVYVSESYMLRMYRDELPLYSANAKCLLQSGSTDIVLDAAVDPLTGKFIVTQTDSQEIFNGLAIETERTVATGGSTFEHGLLWGDAVAEINNANLFASTPATDQRQVNEMVRSLSADIPGGLDLSKAAAWAVVDGTGTLSIKASYNIESVSTSGTGFYKYTFKIPFVASGAATPGYVVIPGGEQFSRMLLASRLSCTAEHEGADGTNTNDNMAMIACFGELENG